MAEIQFIGVTISELAEAIGEILIPNFKTEVLDKVKKEQQTEFLTRTEACEMLKIQKTTLWRWQKKGVLDSYTIEGRSLFKRQDILNVMETKRL